MFIALGLALLMWPRAQGAVVYGNSDLVMAAGVAGGLLWGWPAILLLLKPTLAPLAIPFAKDRRFWAGLALLLVACIPMLALWRDYAVAFINMRGLGWDYSIGSLPLLLVPVAFWLGTPRRTDPGDAHRRQGHPHMKDASDTPFDATPELTVVVPVFKEGEAVDPVLRALTAAITAPHEILVVYDFDEDPTFPVIERLHEESPAIRGLRNDLGRGVLNAMKAGIEASRGELVLSRWPTDRTSRRWWTRMVALARDGADVVAASRYMKGGHQVGGPPLKRLMSRTAGLTLDLVRRCRDPRPDEQLQALLAAAARRHHD